MNQSRAWRTVCDAALLSDEEAKTLLCENLALLSPVGKSHSQVGETVKVARTFLVALAWLDPELAATTSKTLAENLPLSDYFFPWEVMLEEACRAHQLCNSEEALREHEDQIALLPRSAADYQQHEKHSQLRRIGILARLHPFDPVITYETLSDYPYYFQSFSALLDWQILFPLARFCRDSPCVQTNLPHVFYTVSLYVLAKLKRTEDIPCLLALLQQRMTLQQIPLLGLEAAGVFKTLEFLEDSSRQALRGLLPDLSKVLAAGNGDHNSLLTAKALALSETLGLALSSPALLFTARLKRDSARAARRWTRSISRSLRQQFPSAQAARCIAHDLRILAIAQTIERGLTSKASLNPKEESRLRRCWHWLGRSEALIASVSHTHWQADLLHRRARLENQVVRSRKARHRALIQ